MTINTEYSGNGTGSGGVAPAAHNKHQLAGVLKKNPLRDVQNENVGSALNSQGSLLPGRGRLDGDRIKPCGTKRLTPEHPSSSQGFPSLAYFGTTENVANARRRVELELGRGRIQNNVERKSECLVSKNIIDQLQHEVTQKITQMKDDISLRQVPAATSSNPTTAIFSSTGPSVPSYFSKHSQGMPVAKASPQLPRAADSKSMKDQLRQERFICLQNYLKQCDEVNKREYKQMLMHLSAAELSKCAVALEKRAIRLTIEEGDEIQRMRALNILAKSSPANNMLESAPSH